MNKIGSIGIGKEAKAQGIYTTATGFEAHALAGGATAYGNLAKAMDQQSLAIGPRTTAKAGQSTAIGNDTYALGYSSIAIGTDDAEGTAVLPGYKDKISQYDYDNYFKYLYGNVGGQGEKIDPEGKLYGFLESSTPNKINEHLRIYSPTLSRGIGSIAIGSRSVAFEEGSLALGTLSFALKKGATSLGTRTRAEGVGSMALGNLSKVFSDYSVATGNDTQVLKEGGMAYGYKAYSAGEGALALGKEVSANAELKKLNEIKAAFEQETPESNKLTEAGGFAKDIATEVKNDVPDIVKTYSDKKHAIVVGNRAAAMEENSLAIGRSAFSLSENAAAIGSFSYANAKDAMALGVGARVYDRSKEPGQEGHTGISSLAIGTGALATFQNSVSLGVGSRTDYSAEDLQKPGYAPRGSLATPTTAKTGIISVGRKGAERRISNLAAGYLNTDAVNVSQLKALEEAMNINIGEKTAGGLKYLSTNRTGGDSAKIEQKLEKARDYKSYIEHVALNKNLEARQKLNDEVVKEDVLKKITDEISRLETKYTDFSSMQDISDITIEKSADPTENAKKYSELLKDIDEKARIASAKKPEGTEITDYHNADNSGAKGADSLALGYDAKTDQSADNAIAIGKESKVEAKSGIALGNAANVTRENSIAIGKDSKTSGNMEEGYKLAAGAVTSSYTQFESSKNIFTPNFGEFSIGDGDTVTRRITGVAAGKLNTDAVNVAQYKALAEFAWKVDGDSGTLNRTLTSGNILKFEGSNDITTTVAVNSEKKEDKVSFSLNKAKSISNAEPDKEKVVTSGVVYDAIKGAKPTIKIEDNEDILKVTENKSEGIKGDSFTLGIDKEKLKKATEASALSYIGNEEGDKQKVVLSTGLTIKGEKGDNTKISGKNIWVESTAGGIINIKMAENPEFTSVNATEKVSVGEKGKEGITLESKNDGKENTISFKKNPADANGKETGTGSITGLKDLDENSDGTSAANKNYVDDKVKKVSDAINGSDGKPGLIGKVGDPGKDGEDGRNGATSPAGQDGLNGKDLNTKANALRNGEAGIIVYTDADGNRVGKAKDGKYYKLSDIKEDGTANDKATKIPSKQVRHSLVSAQDGSTTEPTALSNVGAGTIAEKSIDAINGSQLKDLADKVGLEVDPKDPTKLADPKLVPTKDSFVKDDKGDIYKKVTEDGKDKYYKLDPATGEFEKAETPSITGEKPVEPKLVDRINVLTALNNDLQAKANKGITFKGDNADGKAENETAVPLGGALNIKGATKDKTVDGTKYMGGNIRVESSSTGMLMYTKADPTFDSITLNKEGLKDSSAVRLSQLNALRKELNLAPISEKDPDGNGIVGDQRDPNASNGGNNPGTGTSPGKGDSVPSTVDSLGKGEKGPVVYTTKEGERVVLAGDNNFYKADDTKGKVLYKDKWYDGDKLKESGGKLYDLSTGKEVKEADLDKFIVSSPKKYGKDSVKLSTVNPDGTTSTPTTLGNIADGKVAKDSKDAVNGGQLFAATGMTEGGKFADGRDGKSGMDANGNPVSDSAASKGNTGKDGLNGLNPNDKANALRNGEAGSVVYTNGAGDRLLKGNDGKYYLSSDLESNGVPKKNSKAVEKVVSTVVQADGTTSSPGVIRVGNGEVSATSTEAVNGSQLHATNSRIDNITANTDAKFEEQGKAISANTERIQGVKNEIGHVGALGAALSALHPMQYDPLQKNQVMAGLGHYRDKQAVAVGVTHYFNENLMMTAGVSVGNENRVKTMANVGITWKIGKDDDREDLPERYKEGPIGSIYMMQEEVDHLLQENRSQKEKLDKQQTEIDEMKKQLQMLLKK